MPKVKAFFDKTYQYYQETGNRSISLKFGDVSEKAEIINAMQELVERGFVQIEAQAMGFIQFKLTPDGIDFYEVPQIPTQPAVQNVNIGTIQGSAIVGSQTNATVNAGAPMAEITDLISKLPFEQQSLGAELLEELKKLESGEKPVQKNALAKFSDLLAKHGSLASAVVALIGKLVIGA